jgi:8-oxo-dGTP diphosphatase
VAAVISKDDKFLVCRRASHKSLAGFWEFPGGKVESGESDPEALKREIQEELGVEIQVLEFICKSEISAGTQKIEMYSYSGVLVSNEPSSSSDHDAFRWVSPHELADLLFPELDLPVVAALKK